MTSSRGRALMDFVTTAVIVVTCGLLVWANRGRIWPPGPRAIAPPEAPVSLDGAPSRGDAAAPVVLVMYSDYQCPFCERFERDTLPTLERTYVRTGKLRVTVRQHPLEQLHPRALDAAVTAICAGRQGRFWEMHAALFAIQRDLSDSRITAEAERLELDVAALTACRDGDAVRKDVKAEGAKAEVLGLTATPAFLVGRVQEDGRVQITSVISGARPIGEFTAAIDEALGQRGTSRGWIPWATVGLALAVSVGMLIARRNRRLSVAEARIGTATEPRLAQSGGDT